MKQHVRWYLVYKTEQDLVGRPGMQGWAGPYETREEAEKARATAPWDPPGPLLLQQCITEYEE